jgi:LacI family transcriptional regulator
VFTGALSADRPAGMSKRVEHASKELAKISEQYINLLDRSIIPASTQGWDRAISMNQVHTQRVTLLDIAADAGVSRATVSLVIRNVPTVADATRKRVLRSIKRLGYVYHRGAASLRTQQSHAIGLIVSDITNPFFAEVIVAIEERLASSHFVTLLGNTSENTDKEESLLKTMTEFPADGILICPALDRGSPREVANFELRLPIVAFARRVPGLDYVGVDNGQGAQLAVQQLYRVGHRRIAFVGGNPNVSTGKERIEGYHMALADLGLRFDPLLIVPSAPTRRGGHESVQRLLQMESRPTATLCFNDVVALGVIEALQISGLKVGADFGVVGFNNIPDAAQSLPGLTTIDTSPRQLGVTAAELLIRRIQNRDSPIQTVILQPKLMVRESCGANSRKG